MAAWFKFKGVSSEAMGVYVTEYPPATIPEERAEFKPIPGRNGYLTLLEGEHVYEDIILTLACFVHDLANLDEIASWLRGSGDLILGNDESKCYRARAVNQIELKTVVRARSARTFDAVFRCKPFRYETTPDMFTLYTGKTLTNPGSVPAYPKLDVTGTGDVHITIGGRSIILTGIGGTITIDCEAMTAYRGAESVGGSIALSDGNWPYFPVGDTAISWTGDVSRVVLHPNWRYL